MKSYQEIYDKAHQEGMQAGSDHTPTPMVVYETVGLFDDTPVKVYPPVMDGACGFAWVNVKPGNSPFAKWLKENTHADKDSYYGGITLWVREFSQSYERKMRYAEAFVVALGQEGIRATASGRLD